MPRSALFILIPFVVVLAVVACEEDIHPTLPDEPTDITIALERQWWSPASLPLDALNVAKPADSRAEGYWYNIEPEFGLHRRDLDPTLPEQQNTLLPSLDMELANDPTPGVDVAFAGVMRGVVNGMDLLGLGVLEIWINDFKPDPNDRGGRLRIDLGYMDENFDAGGTFDDEDATGNGFDVATDDTGLDGLFNANEVGGGDDPAGDDYDPARINGRFSKVNGTEGNGVRDTEDLDRNGVFDRDNGYYSYVINLVDSADVDVRASYPSYDGFDEPGHENDSWRLYRINLSSYAVRAPGAKQPRMDDVRHIRIWFDHLDDVVRTTGTGALRIQIGEFRITGSR